MKKARLSGVFALGLLAAIPAFGTETKPPAPKPGAHVGDPSPQARAAFLALSEADRKAAQDALGWLGLYNGVLDGGFGKRTIDALSAYQQSLGGNADGVMTPQLLEGLKQGAAKAKAAVGFRIVDDPTTGVRIGAPLKLLEKRETGEGTAALISRDGAVGLSFRRVSSDLATLYKTFAADSAARKVTYKIIKPDAFFVVAGEEGENKFYRRYAAGAGGELRGFAFVYPKARAKALDPVALAVANAFDPFPSVPLPPTPAPTAAPPPAPEPPKLTATALIVGPGVALTALDPAQCKAPTVGGRPARFLAAEGALARLGGEFGANGAPPPVGLAGGDLVALSLSTNGARATLAVTDATALAGGAKVLAALGPAASGAPLFDRQGRLVAFVAPVKEATRRGGVVLAAPHAILPAPALGASAPSGAEANLSAAGVAQLRRGGVVGVFCGS